MHSELGGGVMNVRVDHRRAPTLYPAGPFKSKMSPTHLAKTSALPDVLYASLLVEGPDANGHGYVESPRTAQARKPVRVVLSRPNAMKIPHEFRFDLPGSGLVDQLGLFDTQGRLWFFGRLNPAKQRAERPEEFLFPANSVEGFIRRAGEAWS